MPFTAPFISPHKERAAQKAALSLCALLHDLPDQRCHFPIGTVRQRIEDNVDFTLFKIDIHRFPLLGGRVLDGDGVRYPSNGTRLNGDGCFENGTLQKRFVGLVRARGVRIRFADQADFANCDGG